MKKFTLIASGLCLMATASAFAVIAPGRVPVQTNEDLVNPQRMVVSPAEKNEAPTATSTTIWSPKNSTKFRAPQKASGLDRRNVTIPADAEVIIDQDFSLLTEGSEDELGPSLLPSPVTSIDDMFISAEYMGEEGWFGYGLYSAGGAIAITQPTPYGYNAGGVLDTPDLELYGRVFIKFKVKVIPAEGKDPKAILYVSCAIDKLADYPQAVNRIPYDQPGAAIQSFDFSASDGWQEVTMMVYNPYQGNDCFCQINCIYPETGVIVDDFMVYRDYGLCLPPSNLLSYDFTNDGFTARWDPGAQNDSYLLTLISQVEDGEQESTSVNLDNIKVDQNGKITSLSDLKGIEIYLQDNLGTIDEGFEGSGAVIMTSDQDGIILPDEGKPIIEASLYLKSEVQPSSYALLYVIGELNGYPQVVGSIPLTDAVEGKTFNMEDYVVGFGSYTTFMYQPMGLAEGESVIVDNIDWTVSAPFVENTVFEDRPVDSNVVVLTDLDPSLEYFFAVKGVSADGMVSSQTEFKHAIGCPAPNALKASDVDSDEGSYVANWEPSVKANAYEVANYEMRTIAENTPDYTVLYDDFENAKDPDGYGIDITGTSFDGLADNNGWTSDFGLYSESSIGSYYGGDVVSPYLSLGSDNGKFKVKTQLSGLPGTSIIIQCNVTSYQVAYIPAEGNPEELSSEEFEFEFEDGTDMTQLIFYNADGWDTFLIQDIEITQNKTEGDKVLAFQNSAIVDGANSTSYKFTGLMPSENYDYAYTVSAFGKYLGIGFQSNPSNVVPVEFEVSSVDEILNNEEAKIEVVGRCIMIDLPETSVIRVYDLAGRIIRNVEGNQGINCIRIDNPGIYIVNIDGKSVKVLVN